MKFLPDNIEKIKSGKKTATSRTFKLPDGVYNIDYELIISITGYHYDSINKMKDKEKWAVAEGFENFADFYQNCAFKHTKDFMNGKRDIWIYKIEVL